MNQPSIVVVSSSLAPISRSRIAAQYAGNFLKSIGCEVQTVDLSSMAVAPYPASENDPETLNAVNLFNSAHGWVLASPVYNFGMSGVLLNFLHYALDSDRERFKPFVIIETLGGLRSALSSDHLARTMVYEVNAVQVGPAVHAVGDAGINRATGVISPEVMHRIEKSMAALAHYSRARASVQSNLLSHSWVAA